MNLIYPKDLATAFAPLITQFEDQLAQIVVPALQKSIEEMIDGFTIQVTIVRKTSNEKSV
jgi:hypothetical protein